MKTYLRIIGFARPFGLLVPQYLIYTLLHVIFNIVNFAVMIPLLNVLFGVTEAKTLEKPEFEGTFINYFISLFDYHLHSIMVEKGQVYVLYFICAIIVGSTLLSNLFKYLANIILALIRINVITKLRSVFFESILNFDLNYFTSNRRGDIITRGTGDVLEIENSVVSTFAVIIKEPLMIIGLFIVLFKMSAELTLYTIILIPVSGGLISFIVRKLRKSVLGMQDVLGQISNVLDETLGGMRVIKAFAAENYMKKKFEDGIRAYARFNFSIAKTYNLSPPVSEILGSVTLSLLLLFGGQMIFNNEASLSASEFIGFILFFSQILAPTRSLSNSFSTINKGLASGDRVFKLIGQKHSILSKPDGIEAEHLQEGIAFRNVSFAYEEKTILKNIDFEISKGKSVALVGSSGGGKSTIADLVFRFYDVKEGEVLLDGKNLKEYKISSLRNMMGIVMQESILFNDTVFNNVAFGKQNASLEEVIEAARVANAHEFIEKLEDGYDTVIGERGLKLSGGQQQRLSIARAMLKNPSILILDEATSALDSESEKLVQDAIYKLMQNRTTLVIAHRLSTIQNADEILVVKDGEIIERGSHHSLLKEEGLYKKLVWMQSF